MTKIGYIATIQIFLEGPSIESEAQASDWIVELLEDAIVENIGLNIDWQYLKLGGQYLSPQKKIVSGRNLEGEPFEK